MLTNEPKKSSHMFGTTRENILPKTICCCAKWKIPRKEVNNPYSSTAQQWTEVI